MKSLKPFSFAKTIGLAAALLSLSAAAYAQNNQALLARGNEWQRGIPGFGINVFSALFGEYRLESAGTGTPGGVFAVRVSGESLLFTQSPWQARAGIDSARERVEQDSLVVAVPFSGGEHLGSWTILFQFPADLNSLGLDNVSANRLMNAWIARFRYFLALIKTSSDLSLPALVKF
jgi:hypothetical protein